MSGKGFGSRYDRFEPNRANDEHSKVVDSKPFTPGQRLLECRKCKTRKPIRGGRRIGGFTSMNFLCADCK